MAIIDLHPMYLYGTLVAPASGFRPSGAYANRLPGQSRERMRVTRFRAITLPWLRLSGPVRTGSRASARGDRRLPLDVPLRHLRGPGFRGPRGQAPAPLHAQRGRSSTWTRCTSSTLWWLRLSGPARTGSRAPAKSIIYVHPMYLFGTFVVPASGARAGRLLGLRVRAKGDHQLGLDVPRQHLGGSGFRGPRGQVPGTPQRRSRCTSSTHS
jgi:hypothetical protein